MGRFVGTRSGDGDRELQSLRLVALAATEAWRMRDVRPFTGGWLARGADQ